jgi:hypothetical protein
MTLIMQKNNLKKPYENKFNFEKIVYNIMHKIDLNLMLIQINNLN